MAGTGVDEVGIQKAVARRAAELGGRIRVCDVTLEIMDGEVAPGCRLFRASWGVGRAEGALTGLLQDADPPDTYPAQALGKLFRRWLETAGGLPDPVLVARVAAFLYDAGKIHAPILNEEDRANLVGQPPQRPDVQLPARIEVGGWPGIAFWWSGSHGLAQVRLYLGEGGRMQSEERR